MDLKTKKTIVNKLSKEYRKLRKKQRGVILDELIRLTGYNRSYARRILRKPSVAKKSSRVRYSSYSSVFSQLRKLWVISSFACGQRLVPLIPVYLDSLARHGELRVTGFEKKLLLKISSATVDRLLKEEKKKLNITGKGRSYTKPGSLLKHQIPIHIMGRGETGLVKALESIRRRLPFKLLGIDFDCGGEFVNWHLIRYCKRNKLTYTRARESYSNDQPYIEQQNFSVVRTFVGYKRLAAFGQLELLNKLYLKLSDYQNFFQSVMRLKEKTRNGAHVTRRYGKAKTAFQRILESLDIPDEVKESLKERFLRLNPRRLLLEINALSRKVNS